MIEDLFTQYPSVPITLLSILSGCIVILVGLVWRMATHSLKGVQHSINRLDKTLTEAFHKVDRLDKKLQDHLRDFDSLRAEHRVFHDQRSTVGRRWYDESKMTGESHGD